MYYENLEQKKEVGRKHGDINNIWTFDNEYVNIISVNNIGRNK